VSSFSDAFVATRRSPAGPIDCAADEDVLGLIDAVSKDGRNGDCAANAGGTNIVTSKSHRVIMTISPFLSWDSVEGIRPPASLQIQQRDTHAPPVRRGPQQKGA
jgi:hypothetical protein